MENTGSIDPLTIQQGYFEGTDWALPYVSKYTSEHEGTYPREVLKHMNCSYFSTAGRAPTLLALKQHAKALSALFESISPSERPGEVNSERVAGLGNEYAQHFDPNSAFDWLSNLRTPYSNEDDSHHLPLNGLLNLVKSNSDTRGVVFHCPLEHADKSFEYSYGQSNNTDKFSKLYSEAQEASPYKRHMNLLNHANACLEILDHEYSATGGLLSILPLEDEIEGAEKIIEAAKGTLIGQFILHIHNLTGRLHELEIGYARSLDMIEKDAQLPMQHASVHGPDSRSGREIIYPQDRWILANAGDDVHEHIQRRLNAKEDTAVRLSASDERRGVRGEALAGADDERGLISIDISTRYYRLRGKRDGPIFILPAYADRPDVDYTRKLESQPTVVSVPRAQMPNSVSQLEKRMDGWQKDNERVKQEFIALSNQQREAGARLTIAEQEAEEQAALALKYAETANEDVKNFVEKSQEFDAQIQEAQGAAAKATQRADRLQTQLNALMPNGFSYNSMVDTVPRYADGNVTNTALQSLVDLLNDMQKDNAKLREENRSLMNGETMGA